MKYKTICDTVTLKGLLQNRVRYVCLNIHVYISILLSYLSRREIFHEVNPCKKQMERWLQIYYSSMTFPFKTAGIPKNSFLTRLFSFLRSFIPPCWSWWCLKNYRGAGVRVWGWRRNTKANLCPFTNWGLGGEPASQKADWCLESKRFMFYILGQNF